ncbi:uncharacterized protein V6R79_013366 [Siganus canaliculatus]
MRLSGGGAASDRYKPSEHHSPSKSCEATEDDSADAVKGCAEIRANCNKIPGEAGEREVTKAITPLGILFIYAPLFLLFDPLPLWTVTHKRVNTSRDNQSCWREKESPSQSVG